MDKARKREAFVRANYHTLQGMKCPQCGIDRLEDQCAGWTVCVCCDTLFDDDETEAMLVEAIASATSDEMVQRDMRIDRGQAG